MHRTILLLTTVAVLGGCSKSDKTNGKLARRRGKQSARRQV